MTELVVSGMGQLSPVGLGRQALAKAYDDPDAAAARAFSGRSTVLPRADYPQARSAEVWGFDPNAYLGKKGHRNLDRLTKYLIAAAQEALADAGIKRDGAFTSETFPTRVGVCSATAFGSLDAITELNLVAEREDPRYLNPARFPNTVINAAAGYVSIWEDLRALNATVVDGNCGGLDTVLSADLHLAHGRGDGFLVGGGDVLTTSLYTGLRRLGALAEGEKVWAPGRETSEGIRLGEGAAYLFVERPEHAAARGVRAQGRITGYGTAFEPPPEGRLLFASAEAVARAVRSALADAGLKAADIDVVATAASGLRPFDRAEREGLLAVLGPTATLAAPKRLCGEIFAGSAALGLASALCWLTGAPAGPLLCGTRPAEVRDVLVMALGYYGNVSAVVMSRA